MKNKIQLDTMSLSMLVQQSKGEDITFLKTLNLVHTLKCFTEHFA